MERITEIFEINSIDEIPTIETIGKISREKILRLIFGKSIQTQREKIGQELKGKLDGFQIGIHATEPEIRITKLITEKEIELHQAFFESCAKDYRKVANELIFLLAKKLAVDIDINYPLLTFNQFKRNNKETGLLGEWRYYLHGFHCGFENKLTGQLIEVPLIFGLEFGDLDPYFFMEFIKSTKEYQPLPVEIYETYADGAQINKTMLALGKFEKINSSIENHFGIAVTDRAKVKIELYQPNIDLNEVKSKCNLWKFLGIK